MHLPILVLSLLTLLSCGKSDSNAGMPRDFNPHRRAPVNEVNPLKKYMLANLVAINPEWSGNVSGRLTIEQNGFTYKSKLKLSTSVWHKDGIHAGSRCPTKADDVNGDMIIDHNEAKAVVGSQLIPLSDRSRTTSFSGNFELTGKVILINSSTEALACGVLRVVSKLPAETDYEPQPRPEPRPDPTPEPRPTPDPETDEEPENEDDEDEDWTDRWNDWWRCRLGGCD